METAEKDKKDYEISFLAKDEKGVQAVSAALKQAGAEVLVEGPVERIPLAYKIDHEEAAHFGYTHFRASPDVIEGINSELRVNSLVLRSLIITPPFEKDKPKMGQRSAAKSSQTGAPVEPSSVGPLSNEALEKKIEEIMQQ